MKKLLISLCTISALAFSAHASGLEFSSSAGTPVEITPAASTGLASVYVVPRLSGATISYTSNTSGPVTWQRYSNLGGGHAEDITDVSRDGNTYSITSSGDDMGYIVTDAGRQYCYWVTNYANHEINLVSVDFGTDNECDNTELIINGTGDAIAYYSINGRRVELSRDITVSYNTLSYSTENETYTETTTEQILSSLTSSVHVQAPLCNTHFTVTGDRFIKAWGREQQIISPLFTTHAVDVNAVVTQTVTDYDNEQKDGDDASLGGSAPCEINFKAICTDAVVFKQWQMSHSQDFDTIDDTFDQEEFTYTFTDNGIMYVKFVGGNAEGTCFAETDTYTVSIGESRLECPNAFSPANQDGVNDLWKVSFRSITSFECNIFNRWGKKLCTLTHPSQGWDGKVGGKFVPSGVYFYVIKARGADGKNYNLSGDINIINSRLNPQAGTSNE